MKKEQTGFSLIELLIVLVVLSIIAAIAVPNLLAARRASNEGSAISSLRTLHGAQAVYQTSTGNSNYAGTISTNGDLAALSDLRSAGLIDEVLATGTKSGYNFIGARTVSSVATPATFFFSANPIVISVGVLTGSRKFCITQQGFMGYDRNNLTTAFDQNTAPTATPIDPS